MSSPLKNILIFKTAVTLCFIAYMLWMCSIHATNISYIWESQPIKTNLELTPLMIIHTTSCIVFLSVTLYGIVQGKPHLVYCGITYLYVVIFQITGYIMSNISWGKDQDVLKMITAIWNGLLSQWIITGIQFMILLLLLVYYYISMPKSSSASILIK